MFSGRPKYETRQVSARFLFDVGAREAARPISVEIQCLDPDLLLIAEDKATSLGPAVRAPCPRDATPLTALRKYRQKL
jgi:hypothetical protein